MTAAFSVRIDPDLLDESKTAAVTAGESFTAYVSGALRLRNSGGASLLDQPMVPRETLKLPQADVEAVARGIETAVKRDGRGNLFGQFRRVGAIRDQAAPC